MGIDAKQFWGAQKSKSDRGPSPAAVVEDTEEEKRLKNRGRRNPLIFTSSRGDLSQANVATTGLKALLGQ